MAESQSSWGTAFGQGEPLTQRIKGLLREYPRGSILKELIQNADDASARRVRVTIDWRTHAEARLPDPLMKKLLGPALLVSNDASFTEKDFENIRRIGFSGKSQDLTKTGRFGIGFNAVYHVTDWPSFLSRESLVFFDPHCSAIPCTSAEPGRRCEFAREQWWAHYPDFLEMYVAGGLPRNTCDHQGTIFRLPLRSFEHARESQISHEPYTAEEVSSLVDSLFSDGEQLLLFLKSVECIEFAEINRDASSEQLQLRIATINVDEVRGKRETVLGVVAESSGELIERCTTSPDTLPTVSYRHEISTTSSQGSRSSSWRVCGGLRADATGHIAQAMKEMADRGDKAVPWGGAAARLPNTDANTPITGRVYCFLPLPLTTGLPVHLNGFFDLDSSRHGLTVAEGLGPTELIRAQWNQLLVKHVIAPACADLVFALSQDVGNDHPEEYYRLWPVMTPSAGVLSALPHTLVEALSALQVIRVADPRSGRNVFKWLTPSLVDSLSKSHWDAFQPLSCEFNIPSPELPHGIAIQLGIQSITPARVRAKLTGHKSLVKGAKFADAPYRSLRRFEWIAALLRYCLSDGHNDLTGLPLAVMADITLWYFNPDEAFLKDDDTRHIFANRRKWFVHSKLIEAVPDIENRQANLRGLRRMTAVDVANRLSVVLSDVIASNGRWNPIAESPPNNAWLLRVLRYFLRQSNLEASLKLLRQVPLIPGDDDLLHKGGTAATPLLCPPDVNDAEQAALSIFGIRFISGKNEILEALREFANRHPDTLIWSVTGPDVVDTLETAEANFPKYDTTSTPAYDQLLDFLARERASLDTQRKKTLQKLHLFPTIAGQCVCLTEPEVFLPGGYDPPAAPEGIHLLKTGTEGHWKPLLSGLGVPLLDRATLILDYLLARYETLGVKEQLRVLAWIRDNLEQAQTELSNRQDVSISVRVEVAEAELVLCQDGNLRSIKEVYDPSSEVIKLVLGDSAPVPDPNLYSESWDRWSDFFQHLGWRTTPNAIDLLRHVDSLTERSKGGVSSVAAACMSVYDHFRKNIDELKDELVPGDDIVELDQTFAEALRKRSWIPPLDDPRELRRYPGARQPEPRLYRCDKLIVTQQAHVVASQRVLFRLPQPPSEEMRNALGFRLPERDEVIAHLRVLISLWEEGAVPREDEEAFGRSLSSIYRYLDENFVRGSEDKSWLVQQLEGEPSLWDGAGGFWEASHTFQKRGECFGCRRLTFRPAESYVQAVYLLLGQKEEPEASDYYSFLYDLQEDYDTNILSAVDQDLVIQVMRRLASETHDSEPGSPLLTRDGRLLVGNRVIIPDAPWFESYLDSEADLLHPSIDPVLAEKAGAVSLSRDGFQELAGEISVSAEGIAADLCVRWQTSCASPEFSRGLSRLIYDQHGLLTAIASNVPEHTLDGISICAAEIIPMSLYLRMSDGIASVADAIEGDAYYDEPGRTIYLRSDDQRTMLHYLVQSLHYSFPELRSVSEGHLRDMIDTEPEAIEALLDKRRVRSLPAPNVESLPVIESEGDPIPVFDSFWNDEKEDDHSDHQTLESDRNSDTFVVTTSESRSDFIPQHEHGPDDIEAEPRSIRRQHPAPDEAAARSDDNAPENAFADESTEAAFGESNEEHSTTVASTVPGSRSWSAGQQFGQPRRNSPRGARSQGESTKIEPVPAAFSVVNSGEESFQELPDSHTAYDRELFESTPARPFDTVAISKLFPNAQETVNIGSNRQDHSRRRRSPGYSGPMDPVNSSVVCLLARTFEEGVLWLQDPKPAALFPAREASSDTMGNRYYSLVLMGEDAEPLHVSVDYQQEVLHFKRDDDRQGVIDYLLKHGLRPGCEMTVRRLENGGYQLGFVYSPSTVSRVPVLALDDAGRPIVTESTEAIELPCPVNVKLLLSQQRFADDEAWATLNALARCAPDLLQAIVSLLAGRNTPISVEDLYRLNFQIRPVSWTYFSNLIETNSGPEKPFFLEDGFVSLRPLGDVKKYTLPRMRHTSRSRRHPDWDYIESELEQVLASLAGSESHAVAKAVIAVFRRCLGD